MPEELLLAPPEAPLLPEALPEDPDEGDLLFEAPALALFIASNSLRLSWPSLFVSSLSNCELALDFDFALPAPALALPPELAPPFDLALPLEPALALPVEPLLLPLCDIEGFAELEDDEAFLSSAAYAPKARSEKLTIRGVTNFID